MYTDNLLSGPRVHLYRPHYANMHTQAAMLPCTFKTYHDPMADAGPIGV